MKYICAAIVAIILILNISGCTSLHIPRQSFVKIRAEFTVSKCAEEACLSHRVTTYGSGTIVAHKVKTFILTAGHICETSHIKEELKADHLTVEYYILDANGLTSPAEPHKIDMANDLCILFTKRLGHTPIKFRNIGPSFGEKVFNLSAPVGLGSKTYVPILEGRYSGYSEQNMVYTIPAIGGSSGSPIFDRQGQLVGMIMSVNNKFPFVSYSPHHHAIKDLLKGII